MIDLPHPSYSAVKRGIDVAAAVFLSVALFPLLVLIAACIWVEDGRPIFFTQERVGRRGQTFEIAKFRSLSKEPENPARPTAHATFTGRLLRRWGLDELPQLWNVLRGEMSLVGPRPPLPRDVQKYGPREKIRLKVRPGVTGWAQIHGRNRIPWSERIRLDIEYVKERGPGLDLYILFVTPLVLLRGEGVTGPAGRNPGYQPERSPSQEGSLEHR